MEALIDHFWVTPILPNPGRIKFADALDELLSRAGDARAAAGVCAAQQLTRVMSGSAAILGTHVVLRVARDAGLLEKKGLRTDVAYIRSGSTMAQALIAGEIQLAQMKRLEQRGMIESLYPKG